MVVLRIEVSPHGLIRVKALVICAHLIILTSIAIPDMPVTVPKPKGGWLLYEVKPMPPAKVLDCFTKSVDFLIAWAEATTASV